MKNIELSQYKHVNIYHNSLDTKQDFITLCFFPESPRISHWRQENNQNDFK